MAAPATTTTLESTTLSPGVLRLLADYELTHSGEEGAPPASPNARPAPLEPNPSWWPTDYNGIPPYRPINYNLDREQRPWARPGIENAFAFTMLNGVGVVAWFSKVWRATGGRINDQIFRFSVGGER